MLVRLSVLAALAMLALPLTISASALRRTQKPDTAMTHDAMTHDKMGHDGTAPNNMAQDNTVQPAQHQ